MRYSVASLFLPLVFVQACADEVTPRVQAGGGASQSGSAAEAARPGEGGGGAGAGVGGDAGGGRMPAAEGGELGGADPTAGNGGIGGGFGQAGAPYGAAGDSGANGGTGQQVEPVINNCFAFLDARTDASKRVVAWDYTLGSDPGRCLMIALGQAVTWKGQLSTHPLQPAEGTTPSPVLADYPPESTSHAIMFPLRGTFGFVCGSHSAMNGAIKVVD